MYATSSNTCTRVNTCKYQNSRNSPVNKLMSRLQAKELKNADLLELCDSQKDEGPVQFAWLFNLCAMKSLVHFQSHLCTCLLALQNPDGLCSSSRWGLQTSACYNKQFARRCSNAFCSYANALLQNEMCMCSKMFMSQNICSGHVMLHSQGACARG